jgi:hypothetical protein
MGLWDINPCMMVLPAEPCISHNAWSEMLKQCSGYIGITYSFRGYIWEEKMFRTCGLRYAKKDIQHSEIPIL